MFWVWLNILTTLGGITSIGKFWFKKKKLKTKSIMWTDWKRPEPHGKFCYVIGILFYVLLMIEAYVSFSTESTCTLFYWHFKGVLSVKAAKYI